MDEMIERQQRAETGTAPADTPSANTTPAANSGFDLNRPTIIALLYLGAWVFGVTAIVGVVLGYVWKGEAHADWEASHYTYLIRTFWIGFIGSLISVLLMIVLIGFVLLLIVAVLVIIRSILSLINAQKQLPMPNPETWLA